jgi:hypothetical protein
MDYECNTHIQLYHKKKHTLLRSIAAENNNEQQSQNTCAHPEFLQLARENPGLGKPTKREIYYSFRKFKSYSSNAFDSKRTLTDTQTFPHNFFLDFHAQKSIQPIRTAPNHHFNNHSNLLLYGLIYMDLLQQEKPSISLEKCVSMHHDLCSLIPCCMNYTDPYNITCTTAVNFRNSQP